jgi:hypothetical protein
MAVDIATTPVFQPGTPKPLFQIPAGATIWDAAFAGQRFLLPVLTAESSRVPFMLVLNWMGGLGEVRTRVERGQVSRYTAVTLRASFSAT